MGCVLDAGLHPEADHIWVLMSVSPVEPWCEVFMRILPFGVPLRIPSLKTAPLFPLLNIYRVRVLSDPWSHLVCVSFF